MPKVEPFPSYNDLYPEDWFTRLDRCDLFSGDKPIELDLGCGDGSFLIRMAEQFPERNFLGVERLLGRVRKVSRKAIRAGLENVRVLRADSNYSANWLLPTGFASRIHFLCPDPWPKKKHAARRQMCQMSFLKALHGLLEEGGEVHGRNQRQTKSITIAPGSRCTYRIVTVSPYRVTSWSSSGRGS